MAGLHDDHRQRLKKRYLEYGIDSLEPHVLLELILSYAIPRRDTNPLAHRLLGIYGTVSNVVSAPVSDLIKVEGISEHTALLLKMFGDVSDKLRKGEADTKVSFKDLESAAAFVVPVLSGLSEENVWLFCLTNGMQLMSHRAIFVGDINTVRFRIRSVTEAAFAAGSSKVVIAHNHPGGSSLPSGQDLDTTERLRDSLASNSIVLVEHFVVGSGGSYTPIIAASERSPARRFL